MIDENLLGAFLVNCLATVITTVIANILSDMIIEWWRNHK